MMLEIKGLHAGYGGRVVLHDISLSVDAGEILALVGPNGAGKTTIIRAASGTLPTVKGGAAIAGKHIPSLSPAERARLIAVVPQARQMGGAFTVRQAVMMGRTAYMGWLGRESGEDSRSVDAALAQTHLSDFAERQIAHLSGGEQQRVLLARALAQNTPVLLLDEPTNHLDLRHQTELLHLIRSLAKERGLAVVLAMHDLNLVSAIADRVAILVEGRVHTVGVPRDVLTAETISAAYGLPVVVMEGPAGGKPVIFPRDLFKQNKG